MANYRHGGRRFRSIREAQKRRSTEGVLNARREAEADIRPGRYVGPDGRGFDVVEDTETGQRYTLKDLSGGHTMAPGSKVPIGAYSGSFAQFRLGSPAGGGSRFGSPAKGKRGRPAPAAADQYAFGDDSDGNALATLYSGGTYVSTRATLEGTSGAGVYQAIFSDPNSKVGNGSAIGVDGSTHFIWDVSSGMTYFLPAPSSGYFHASSIYYNAGRIYWFDHSDIDGGGSTTSLTLRLYSALADATDQQLIATLTSSLADAEGSGQFPGNDLTYFIEDGFSIVFMVDSDGAVAYYDVRPQDDNGEIVNHWLRQLRINLSNGSIDQRLYSDPEPEGPLSATVSDGLSFRIVASDCSVVEKGDDATDGTASKIDPIDGHSVKSFWSTRSGAIQLYADSGLAYVLYRSPADGTAWVQVATSVDPYIAAVEDPPTSAIYPDSMFYFGD